jgi:hypothetical protein
MPRRPTLASTSATITPAVDPLGRAFDLALTGDTRPLFAFLARYSGLPGVKANANMALAFASQAATRGKRADALIRSMATIHPDRAPGGTELEFLPLCGVAAIGARAASDPKVVRVSLDYLEAAAEDLRFRVRDEVPRALARIGTVRGESLVDEVAGWMNGFFQSAAVLIAATDNGWLSTIHAPEAIVSRLDEAFQLARGAERAAERYPGYKALVDALSIAPRVFAGRFGAPVFDKLVLWSTVKEPMLRDAIVKSIGGTRLSKRFAPDVMRVQKALEASAPVRRDPLTDVGPTRRRGKKGKR